MKPTQAAQRMRSAIAPVINAGVITANANWNTTNANVGIVPVTLLARPFKPTKSKLPKQPPSRTLPNARE